MAAAPLQVTRNILQRGLVGDAGPWGATLVRFLFGLPFSITIFLIVAWFTPNEAAHVSLRFGLAILLGAIAQVAATACLMVAMRQSGFAVATLMQQSSLPLSALMGLAALGDVLHPVGWMGIGAATAGLVILSWPKRDQVKGATVGAWLGLSAGALFAVSQNAYRDATINLDPHHPIYAATASVCIAQVIQSLLLTIGLTATRPAALRAVATSWRPSLGAGFFGAAASACWFAALALAPAGQVRAVGVIEAPIATIVGRRFLKETLTLRQLVGGALAALGVVATALG